MDKVYKILEKDFLRLNELEELTNLREVKETQLLSTKFYKHLGFEIDLYKIYLTNGDEIITRVKYD